MSEADSTTPVAAAGQERLQRRLVARGQRLRPAARVALGVEQVVVERERLKISRCSAVTACRMPRVDVAQRLGDALALGPRRSAPRA